MSDPKPTADDVKSLTEMRDASACRPATSGGGEDESSAASDGDESGLHEDQKPIRGDKGESASGTDRHKTEEFAKAGRNIDTDAGSE